MDEARARIRSILLASKQASQAQMELIRNQSPLSRNFLHEHLRRYVLDKYLLTPTDCPPDEDFHVLAEISLAKSMKVSKELVEEFDTAQSCDGATSVMTKKVLLFIAIQRDMGIELPAVESARIKTLGDLSDLVWETLSNTPTWSGKLAL